MNPTDLTNLLPHLYYFLSVARTHSFTRAAEALGISQSAVSYQIKNLEEKLGVRLFHRDRRQKVTLTVQGRQLAEQCGRL